MLCFLFFSLNWGERYEVALEEVGFNTLKSFSVFDHRKVKKIRTIVDYILHVYFLNFVWD